MKTAEKTQTWLIETVKTLFWAFLIAGIFRTAFFQPFWIPSGSMKNSLLVGDFLFVNKMAYGYSRYSCPFALCPIKGRILFKEPKRGDVVVFRHPVSNVDYIKRVIGLPGDRVQLKEGQLFLNGEAVETELAGVFNEKYSPQGRYGSLPVCQDRVIPHPGESCQKELFWETLPSGRNYNILNTLTNGTGDTTQVFVVPEKSYFFLGDNRDNSMDSRYMQARGGVGFVDEKYLIGRAERIIFSSAGRSMFFFWTWRADRFFKVVI